MAMSTHWGEFVGSPDSLATDAQGGALVDSDFRAVAAELVPARGGGHELVAQALMRPDFLSDVEAESTDAGGTRDSGWRLAVKRAIDIAGSVLLLALFAPVLLLASLAIIATSPGHVLFVQERLGRDARPFRMMKFRSMYRDAEARRAELADLNECTGPVFKVRNDPRITPVGRV
ncbi:MAG: sugar transferase, partial [Actinomycetota bacterium]|nr:sugar transferase [Actinomycetota bacterium]